MILNFYTLIAEKFHYRIILFLRKFYKFLILPPSVEAEFVRLIG